LYLLQATHLVLMCVEYLKSKGRNTAYILFKKKEKKMVCHKRNLSRA